tara:strand:- start:622 stop:3054 length:2433 start_codon:yes stop_codon:yes gene_type:complete
MNQIETKSILAKCLATENIEVIHDKNMPTAAFDVKNRKLLLPVWKEMSTDLYDLFIGHEVGHAHETPEEGWHDFVIEDMNKKAFLNVVEDVRIEKKIKARYPGLVKSFYKGYKELFDKDFFGIGNLDVDQLPLIDRVNLHYKVGHLLGVTFAEHEKDLVERIGKVKTFEEVMKLAEELYGNHKKEQEERQEDLSDFIEKNMPHPFTQEGQEELQERQQQREAAKEQIQEERDAAEEAYEKEENRRRDLQNEAWDNDQEFDEDQFKDEDGRDEHASRSSYDGLTWDERQDLEDRERKLEEEEKEDAKSVLEAQKEKDLLDEIQDYLDEDGHSITDSQFRKNEKGLVDEDSKDLKHVKPFKGEVADYVVPMEEVYDWNECARVTRTYREEDSYMGSWKEEEITDVKGYGQKLWKEYEPKQRSIINSMAQQFELRKAATSFKKSRISKTGKLNEDKLWAYKITEDLFHQTQIVPQGKNHGILMFVDMSGSMNRQMKGTLEQMETMAMFCRRVNIPFDVYGFSDSGKRTSSHTKQQLVDELTAEGGRGNFSFAHLLSSKWNNVQWNDAMAYLQVMKKGYERSRYYTDLTDGHYVYLDNRFFRLGGTPLVAALTLAPELAKRFQKNYNVEKLTTIILTDGDPTDDLTFVDDPDADQHWARHSDKKFVIKDGATTFSIPTNDSYYNNRKENVILLLEYYKRITQSVLINFHLLDDNSRRGFEQEVSKNNFCNKVSRHYIDEDVWKETLARKFMRVEDDFGYTARFLIKGKGELEIKDEELEVKSNKKGDLLRGFRKFQKGKSTQRVFLNQIIELVA